MTEGSFVQEINLYELLKHYTKYTIFIIALTLIGLAAGYGYSQYLQVPLYKSDATLILIQSDTSVNQPKIINNYIEIVKSRKVLEPVISNVGLNLTYEQFVKSVSTSNDKDTEVLKLSIATTDKNTSKQAVNATIKSFKEEVKRLYDVNSIEVVDPASTPTVAYNVKTNIQLSLAAVTGFILAIITIFFIYDFKLSTKYKKRGSLIDDKSIAKGIVSIFKFIFFPIIWIFKPRKKKSVSKKSISTSKRSAKKTNSAKAKKITKKTTGK